MSHLSTNWDYASRIIPTRYETRYHDSDFWRPRWEMAPVQHHTPPFPTSLPPPPPEFSSSLVHYPTRGRHMGEFDVEMKRMNDEMGKMFKNVQMAAPRPSVDDWQLSENFKNVQMAAPRPSAVDDWRLSENFRMENPVQHFGDGTRKFQLQFDMRQFKPEEIQVKTSGNTLTVYAKHDEKDPNKSVYREYNRSYVLPKDVKPERLTSKLSTEGILTIEAPLPAIEGPTEKLIPIKHN